MSELINDRDGSLYQFLNYTVITNLVSFFGVVTNVMNIVVFYKQGFGNTMNISFFGLAISDLCSLLTMMWFCLFITPDYVDPKIPMDAGEVLYLTGGIPHIYFARITSWITVYITAERCLCIILPLKIKQIITPKRTTGTLCIIVLVITASFLPEYVTAHIGWTFVSKRNKTLLALVFSPSRGSAAGLVFIMYSILGSVSFAAVIVFTVVLVVQLKQKSKWRMKANEDKSMSESISTRERRTVTMVVMIATVLIVCYIPGVAVSMVTFFEPQFSVIGINVNAFFVCWSFVFIFEAVNSSVNILLYYRMSSKYRETFNHVFGIKETLIYRHLIPKVNT